jgi:hypothetical protein
LRASAPLHTQWVLFPQRGAPTGESLLSLGDIADESITFE